MCRIIVHKATLTFNHSFFYLDSNVTRVLPDLLKIPCMIKQAIIVVLIAYVCMASEVLKGDGGMCPWRPLASAT